MPLTSQYRFHCPGAWVSWLGRVDSLAQPGTGAPRVQPGLVPSLSGNGQMSQVGGDPDVLEFEEFESSGH